MLLHKKGYIDHEVIKLIASAALGAACSYVGLYHSVKENGTELRHRGVWMDKMETRVDALENKLDTKLENIGDTLTDIKVLIAKSEK